MWSLGDAGAERLDPVVWPAGVDDVADVEVEGDGGGALRAGVEFVDVAGGFEGGEEETVPDVFDGDGHACFLSDGEGEFDLLLAEAVAVFVGVVAVDHAGDEQHAVCAEGLGGAEAVGEGVEALLADVG